METSDVTVSRMRARVVADPAPADGNALRPVTIRDPNDRPVSILYIVGTIAPFAVAVRASRGCGGPQGVTDTDTGALLDILGSAYCAFTVYR